MTDLLKFDKFLGKSLKSGITNRSKLFILLRAQGYAGSYSSLYRHLKIKYEAVKYYKPSIRVETKPGEQAQVDWGSFGGIKVGSKFARLYCFVYVLSFSRMMYAEFVVKMNLQTFLQCHIHAFEMLGIPREVVYDNMKTVVVSRERLLDGKVGPHYQSNFLDFSKHYGFSINLCPPYWPRSKGKVEACIKYIRQNFMQGLKLNKGFSSLDDLNQKVTKWLQEVANSRDHRTTGRRPIDLWIREKGNLRSLEEFPPYNLFPFTIRNSTKDCFVQYKANFYFVPVEYARRKLLVREMSRGGTTFLEVYYWETLIVTHELSTDRARLIRSGQQFDHEKNRTAEERLEEIESEISDDRLIRPLSYYDSLMLTKNE